MHILIGVHGFPPLENGGAERRAERTALGLVSRGHRVTVLVSAPGPAAAVSRSTRDGLDIWRSEWMPVTPDQPFVWTYDRPDRHAFFADAIATAHPDLVHVFSGYGSTAAAVRAAVAAPVPTVVSLTDFWWLCERVTLVTSSGVRCEGPSPAACGRCHAEMRRRYRWLDRLAPGIAARFWRAAAAGRGPGGAEVTHFEQRIAHQRTVLGNVSAVVVPSAYVARQHVHLGLDASHMTVTRQGVVAPDDLPTRVPDAALRVGYLGQIKPHKGVDLLLGAWRRLTGAHPRRLTLWGDASGEPGYAASLRADIAAQGNGVAWSGEIHGHEVWEALANLDVVVVPSRWAENSPNVILEAQALGIPVVGARIGGIPELVRHDDNGLLFEVDSAGDLARQLQRMLDEPDLVSRLSARAVAPKTFEHELDELERIYRRLAPHA